jgi:hypothetical protein
MRLIVAATSVSRSAATGIRHPEHPSAKDDRPMHQTHNTLSENIRTQSVALLNKQLAAAIYLHGQIKQAHWNVRGPNFIAIHQLFDKV